MGYLDRAEMAYMWCNNAARGKGAEAIVFDHVATGPHWVCGR
jgi:hypothetical protein